MRTTPDWLRAFATLIAVVLALPSSPIWYTP